MSIILCIFNFVVVVFHCYSNHFTRSFFLQCFFFIIYIVFSLLSVLDLPQLKFLFLSFFSSYIFSRFSYLVHIYIYICVFFVLCIAWAWILYFFFLCFLCCLDCCCVYSCYNSPKLFLNSGRILCVFSRLHHLYHNIHNRIRRLCIRHMVRSSHPIHCLVSIAKAPVPIAVRNVTFRWPSLKLISFR